MIFENLQKDLSKSNPSKRCFKKNFDGIVHDFHVFDKSHPTIFGNFHEFEIFSIFHEFWYFHDFLMFPTLRIEEIKELFQTLCGKLLEKAGL